MSPPVNSSPADFRAFIAIKLSSEIQSQLTALISKFKARNLGGVRWVAVESIHLTLKFLGNITQAQITKLNTSLVLIGSAFDPYPLDVFGTGAFPNIRKPRVIWVGLQAPPHLAALQREVEAAAEKIGIPPEVRGFSPHLTIGRVRNESTTADLMAITAALSEIKAGLLGSMTVDSFWLIRSDLHPQGPMYTTLANFSLKH